MAIVNVLGPAHGNLTACGPFAISPSGMAISSTSVRPSSGAYCFYAADATGQFAKRLPADDDQIACVVAFRMDTAGVTAGGAVREIVRFYTASDTFNVALKLDGRNASEAASAKIQLQAGATSSETTQTHSIVPVSGTWYVADILIDATANPWSVTWRVKQSGASTWTDGTDPAPAVAASSFRYYKFGPIGAVTGFHTRLQDCVISTGATAYIDDVYCSWFPPDSAGTHNLDTSPSAYWNEHDGASGNPITSSDAVSYTRIDDTPVGGTSDRVYASTTPGATQYLEYTFPSTSETPLAVKVVEAVQQDSAAGGSAFTSKVTDDGGSSLTTVSSALDPNSTSEVYATTVAGYATTSAVVTAPPSGGSWTSAAFNSLAYRWGFTSDASPTIRLNSVGLEAVLVTQPATVEATFVMPWEAMSAPLPTLGETSSTASVPRVWLGTRAPLQTDDSSTGAAIGDTWVYAGDVWWLVDATADAAVWLQVTS